MTSNIVTIVKNSQPLLRCAGICLTPELAEQTELGEKAWHRMLSPRGNPTTRNLLAVTKAICDYLSFKPRVAVGANS